MMDREGRVEDYKNERVKGGECGKAGVKEHIRGLTKVKEGRKEGLRESDGRVNDCVMRRKFINLVHVI